MKWVGNVLALDLLLGPDRKDCMSVVHYEAACENNDAIVKDRYIGPPKSHDPWPNLAELREMGYVGTYVADSVWVQNIHANLVLNGPLRIDFGSDDEHAKAKRKHEELMTGKVSGHPMPEDGFTVEQLHGKCIVGLYIDDTAGFVKVEKLPARTPHQQALLTSARSKLADIRERVFGQPR